MRHSRKRALCGILSLCAALEWAAPAWAAPNGGAIPDGVQPTYDEAYYATTDYYGNLTDGSVVKSYVLNGASSITDRGTYDEVVNLTDGSDPVRSNGTVTFSFGPDAPSRFYFEGKTKAPFRALPWKLSVHYSLNGVPVRGEDLAGKTGLVEIVVDAVPSESAALYARNNYVLTCTAVFNQDDILSLEAPGAQLQLIGNLRTALFLAFPGEEQQFVMRVGAEDFSFGGLTFLLMPATLSQLEEIAKLNEKKTDLEDSYHDLSDSLDAVLDAFEGMQGSLQNTADGLDALNRARDTVSKGKGTVYADTDALRRDLDALSGALDPVAGEARSVSGFVSEGTAAVNALTDHALSLRGNLESLEAVGADAEYALEGMEQSLVKVEAGLEGVRVGLEDTEAGLRLTEDGLRATESGLEDVEDSLNALSTGLRRLEDGLAGLEDGLDNIEDGLGDLEKGEQDVRDLLRHTVNMKSSLTSLQRALKDVQGISTGGVSGSGEIRESLAQINLFDTAYQAEDFPAFLAVMLLISGRAGSMAEAGELAAQLAPLAQVPELPEDNENYPAWVSVRQQYALFQAKDGMDFETFCAQVTGDRELASRMDYLHSLQQGNNAPALDILLDGMDDLLDDLGGVTTSANSAIRDVASPAAAVIGNLATLCDDLDNLEERMDDVEDLSDDLRDTLNRLQDTSSQLRSVSGDARDLLGRLQDASADLRGGLDGAEDLLGALDATSAGLRDALGALETASASVRDVSLTARTASGILRGASETTRTVLGDGDELRNVLNRYEPVFQSALNTLGSLGDTAAGTVRSANRLALSAEALLKSAGQQLDTGTKQSLDGLSDTLRKAADGMDATDDLRAAKDTVTDLIEDTWDEYTGDVNNLLLMDAEAEAESLTSSLNPAPQSVQILIRTQEIEAEDEDSAAASLSAAGTDDAPTTFLGRVGKMFRDFWHALTGLFH